jgi:RHS repeat-associated protein
MTKLDFCVSRYTGKERDTESGLDYMGGRYYGSTMGRFMSPDWSVNPISIPFARLDNPQTLNLYGYVGNNPLRYFDPYGHSKDCGGGGDPSVVCIVTTAIDKIKSWFSGSGSSSGNTQAATPAPSPDPQFRVTSTIRPAFRAPDFYSASLQLGYAAPSVSYMPSTKNYFAGPGGAGPHGVGLMFTAGWSKRPEDFLSGSSASGCAYAGIAVCGGSSLTSFAPTLQVGINIGPPGGSLSGGYNLDWNSYTQSLYESLPVENPNGAVGIGSGLSYNPCTDDFNCQ